MWPWLQQHSTELLSGLSVTLLLMLCALLLGFFLAIALSLIKTSQCKWLTLPVDAYIFFMRGSPLLVQIFLIYYGLGQFAFIRESIFWALLHQPFVCAVIALSLNSAAYTSVFLTAAINATPEGETEAGYALGMSRWQVATRLILPRSLISFLPAYSNEVILILKATSLASTITLLDLMGVTREIIAQTFEPMQALIAAGIIYLLITIILVKGFHYLEKRWRFSL